MKMGSKSPHHNILSDRWHRPLWVCYPPHYLTKLEHVFKKEGNDSSSTKIAEEVSPPVEDKIMLHMDMPTSLIHPFAFPILVILPLECPLRKLDYKKKYSSEIDHI